jgi:signal transduction histidine kinase
MPLLRIPQKMARSEKVTRADVFDMSSERLIAQGRVVVCLISLIDLTFGPPTAQNATAAIFALAVYAVFSTILVAVTSYRFLNGKVQRFVHFADVATTCLLLILTDGSASPFLVLFIFVLLAATLRWRWQAVLATAAAPALVLAVASVINSTASYSLGTALLRGTSFLTMAAMLAYVGGLRQRSREQFARLAQGPGLKSCAGTVPSLQEILAHTSIVLEAPRVLVVWEEVEEPYVYWAYWREGDYQEDHERVGTFGTLADPALCKTPFLMDDAHSDTLILSKGPQQIKCAINEDLITKFSMRGVATGAFAGATCKGRLFILDRNSWNDEHLLLTQIMAYRTGIRLDLLTFQRQNEIASAMKERMRLTRDLHDGILQSLTAAALQLSLTEKTSDLARLEIIKELLGKEQRRIREFVDVTIHKPVSGKHVVRDLQQVVQDSGRSWNCNTTFSITPDDAHVPQAMADQLSLMLAEAIANAARHGEASNVDVVLTRANGYVDITIRDNGKGFASVPVSYQHEKPASIYQRVRALGGSVNVQSSSTGAELAIRVPAS